MSAGRALSGQALRIGPGDRICVRGPTLATRLLDAELALTSDGFLETDDLGYLAPTGDLFVYGRASERLVSGGENVDPLQVEAALLRDPAVLGACVFGVPDPDFGELVACALVVAPDFDAAAQRGLAAFAARERRLAAARREGRDAAAQPEREARPPAGSRAGDARPRRAGPRSAADPEKRRSSGFGTGRRWNDAGATKVWTL